ncbi:MAG: polysaccharide deacetylase family protein, partial [Verrucomicrobiota bacterium]
GAQELELDDVYYSARTNQKVLALTFDDGPHPTHTPRLLDILKERNAKCTFFVVGNMARNRTSILRRIVAEGHEIANHTVKHDNLARYSNSALRAELTAAHQMIVAATGIPPRMMRPPGGAITKDQRKLMLKEFGYPTIMWSCDPEDWKKPGVSVVTDRLIKGAKPGGILLLHDLHGPTIDAVPRTLDTLIAQGYRFITMSELIALDQRPESSGQ